MFRVRAITAEETLPLRQAILRPNQPLHELVFPGDLDPTSFHAGGYAAIDSSPAPELLGVASVYNQGLDGATAKGLAQLEASGSWRLRGMATHERVRGSGLGGQLLTACIEHARSGGGDVMWCNARLAAADFYRRFGFVVHGEQFELPSIGPHFLMSRRLR